MELDTKIKILVIDDMPNMRKTIKNMLRSIGFSRIIEAHDGQNGLEKIESGGFGLVISDWNMPVMNGIQLLKKTRENVDTRSIPFLIVTAEISQAQITYAAETEVDGYVIKPFDAATLKKKIESIFKRKSKPSPIDAMINLGRAMIRGEQYANAIDALNRALEEYPKSARLMVAIGDAYEAQLDFAVAGEYYLKARKTNPLFVKAINQLAGLHLRQKDHKKALKFMEEAAKISPNDPQRQMEMGKAYLATGDEVKARQAFNIVIKEDEKNLELQKEIGEVYMSAGLEEYAVQAFKRVLDADPSMIHVYNRLGIALRKKSRFKEAVEEYHKAIKISPDDEALHFNLSKAYMDMKNKTKAREAINKALAIDPEFGEARAVLKSLDE
ncbi:Chemotaxis regulator - transmits chemoreceptor signals to flagellar motor components CheY [hydrothermal vent metagenome]|uniref:Chemotaxis regulator - transmits chemoreceptor signals to flagellar motor components CheY n=1 Tax=hydrothermal vent metagenome TaxID=652676 RepID=A0A3B1BBJ7_9ZZZZ